MKFSLEPIHKTELQKIYRSGMSPVIIIQRAKILLGVNRHTIDFWVKKYRQRKPENNIMEILSISKGRGRKEKNTGEAKTWLISIAYQKSADPGYATETWTTSALT